MTSYRRLVLRSHGYSLNLLLDYIQEKGQRSRFLKFMVSQKLIEKENP
jgi:hypothetical protein